MSEKTCGTCEHWHKHEHGLDLSAPRGDCREGPPCSQKAAMANGQEVTMSFYPVLPANFAACGRHKSKIAVLNGQHEETAFALPRP